MEMPIYGTSRYKHVESGKNTSHLKRVNSSSNSSKTIVPRKIIEWLNLQYDDDYLEWKVEMKGGRKVAIVRKFGREVQKWLNGEKGNMVIADWANATRNTGFAMAIFLMLDLTFAHYLLHDTVYSNCSLELGRMAAIDFMETWSQNETRSLWQYAKWSRH